MHYAKLDFVLRSPVPANIPNREGVLLVQQERPVLEVIAEVGLEPTLHAL